MSSPSGSTSPSRRRCKLWQVHALGLTAGLAVMATLPACWCSRQAAGWYRGDPVLQDQFVRGLERWLTAELRRDQFTSGSPLINGEWLFGAYMMTGMGLGQTALQHPEKRTHHAALMDLCIERLLSPRVREFDVESWQSDPIASLDTDAEHAAYLGYLNLLLSLHRVVDPQSRHAELNDRITRVLASRLERSPHWLLQSYPKEVYPVDNCAVIGSIGLHARATGANHVRLLSRCAAAFRTNCIHPATGLLHRGVDYNSAAPLGGPTGSGSMLGAYLLAFGEPELARPIYLAGRRELYSRIAGFGLLRESPGSLPPVPASLDSGPILFGYGVGATGFAIGPSRQFEDLRAFRGLVGTAHLFGAPVTRRGRTGFAMGGPIGDAILFAMLTARLPGGSP